MVFINKEMALSRTHFVSFYAIFAFPCPNTSIRDHEKNPDSSEWMNPGPLQT